MDVWSGGRKEKRSQKRKILVFFFFFFFPPLFLFQLQAARALALEITPFFFRLVPLSHFLSLIKFQSSPLCKVVFRRGRKSTLSERSPCYVRAQGPTGAAELRRWPERVRRARRRRCSRSAATERAAVEAPLTPWAR